MSVFLNSCAKFICDVVGGEKIDKPLSRRNRISSKSRNGRLFRYKDGSAYGGEMKSGQKHGAGTLYYADGSVFTGGWRNDKKHGKGVFIHSDGSSYTGYFKNNVRIGTGIFTFSDGRSYLVNYDNVSSLDHTEGEVPTKITTATPVEVEEEKEKFMEKITPVAKSLDMTVPKDTPSKDGFASTAVTSFSDVSDVAPRNEITKRFLGSSEKSNDTTTPSIDYIKMSNVILGADLADY